MEENQEDKKLQRGLEARHIELIALGGTIGVGLFMGSASTLKWAGPSVLLAYAIAGLFIFFIMRIMGEMLYSEPVAGSFAVYAHKYINPYFGYLTAWSYWLMWIAVGISEITAAGVYVQYWFPGVPEWLPAIAFVGILAASNLLAVRLYGEFEFWFGLIKISTIVVMILVGMTSADRCPASTPHRRRPVKPIATTDKNPESAGHRRAANSLMPKYLKHSAPIQ